VLERIQAPEAHGDVVGDEPACAIGGLAAQRAVTS
jgi:hypothetical protein